jgi:hypothetical protein
MPAVRVQDLIGVIIQGVLTIHPVRLEDGELTLAMFQDPWAGPALGLVGRTIPIAGIILPVPWAVKEPTLEILPDLWVEQVLDPLGGIIRIESTILLARWGAAERIGGILQDPQVERAQIGENKAVKAAVRKARCAVT